MEQSTEVSVSFATVLNDGTSVNDSITDIKATATSDDIIAVGAQISTWRSGTLSSAKKVTKVTENLDID